MALLLSSCVTWGKSVNLWASGSSSVKWRHHGIVSRTQVIKIKTWVGGFPRQILQEIEIPDLP